MSYRNVSVAITGTTGFLGSQIKKHLWDEGADVTPIEGDIRNPKTFEQVDRSCKYLFHFAAPSSQVLFKRQMHHCIETTTLGFLNVANVCMERGIKLIYPSTGLLSSPAECWNEYARCKKVCEDIHLGSDLDALGLRIFATYGPKEGHKGNYASVPYLFTRDVLRGRAPVIFGDGNQVRDFVYIKDVVADIVTLADECDKKIVDIGSGESTSFNRLLDVINSVTGADIGPRYEPAPHGYVMETHADTLASRRIQPAPRTSLEDGIRDVVEYIRGC